MEEVIKKLKEHDVSFVEVNKRFDDQEDQLGLIARTVADHTEHLDRIKESLDVTKEDVSKIIDIMATKDDISKMMDIMVNKEDISKIMNTLDAFVGMYKKKDEETLVNAHNVRKLDDRVVVLENDFIQIRPILGLS
ncbi:MAG: hypothetical protein WCT11_01965 [Candidatus Magasanikbacteria bacterium]|jgi:hypothetical protein